MVARKVSERSLENLKLGSQARYQGKARHNFTVLPETVEWLKATGNASDTIDALVAAAKNGGLKSSNTHKWKEENKAVDSDSVYRRISELETELEQMRLQLETSRKLERDATDQLCSCHSDAFKAADILKAALKLRSNAGGAIKREIEKALPLIDDV